MRYCLFRSKIATDNLMIHCSFKLVLRPSALIQLVIIQGRRQKRNVLFERRKKDRKGKKDIEEKVVGKKLRKKEE